LVIHTCGQPSDPTLMNALYALMMGAEAAGWPAHLLDDPAEVVLRGELGAIEQEEDR
jgi:hypothetical protein